MWTQEHRDCWSRSSDCPGNVQAVLPGFFCCMCNSALLISERLPTKSMVWKIHGDVHVACLPASQTHPYLRTNWSYCEQYLINAVQFQTLPRNHYPRLLLSLSLSCAAEYVLEVARYRPWIGFAQSVIDESYCYTAKLDPRGIRRKQPQQLGLKGPPRNSLGAVQEQPRNPGTVLNSPGPAWSSTATAQSNPRAAWKSSQEVTRRALE